MLKKISTIGAILALCGCSIMPGMQNLDTVKMRTHVVPEHIEVHPTLTPITPSLIADQRVSIYFYRVAPADVLHINVWEHPEFSLGDGMPNSGGGGGGHGAAGSGGYLVNSSGQIFFPLIGYIHVAGKTVDELRAIITARLKKYVPDPQINIRVSDFRGQKNICFGRSR